MRIIYSWIQNNMLSILRYETVQYFLLISSSSTNEVGFLGCRVDTL